MRQAIVAMTYPRRNLFEPGQGGAYHCVSRCVRRAWLCGIDSYTKKSFEHRKPIVEARVQQLGEIFAVCVHTYAVMSNHLHIVLSVAPRSAYQWSADKVARRWLTLYSPKPIDYPARHAELCADPARLAVLRQQCNDLEAHRHCQAGERTGQESIRGSANHAAAGRNHFGKLAADQ